jgi:hypothetical protein
MLAFYPARPLAGGCVTIHQAEVRFISLSDVDPEEQGECA